MAKTTTNFVRPTDTVDTSSDGKIVPKADAVFSVTLDTTGFADKVISAGHPIIKVTADGTYKPQAVSNGALVAIAASGEEYAGVLNASILTEKPIAAVAQIGIVNTKACKYEPLAAAKTALTHILFTQDI